MVVRIERRSQCHRKPKIDTDTGVEAGLFDVYVIHFEVKVHNILAETHTPKNGNKENQTHLILTCSNHMTSHNII
jgi:hypothetical protein